jgi:hypothetical protein
LRGFWYGGIAKFIEVLEKVCKVIFKGYVVNMMSSDGLCKTDMAESNASVLQSTFIQILQTYKIHVE